MFAATRYIAWAMQFYGKVPYDLATSGVPLATWDDLEVPPPEIDDAKSYAQFRDAIAQYNDVGTEEVVPALGTSHALFLAYAAMLSFGDEILVEHPRYEPLTGAAEG